MAFGGRDVEKSKTYRFATYQSEPYRAVAPKAGPLGNNICQRNLRLIDDPRLSSVITAI